MRTPTRTITQEIAHLRFMVEWWSGAVLPHIRDEAKASDARRRMDGLIQAYGHG